MIVYLIIILCGIIADQLSKYFAQTILSQMRTLPLIQDVFHLTYTRNTGAAFSIFTDQQLFLILLTEIFTAVLFIVLIILPKKKEYTILNLSLSLIIAGAAGNLIDRIRLDYVIDFFDFRLINFAIFNVADIFVVCGSALLIFAIWTNRIPKSKDELKIFASKKDADE